MSQWARENPEQMEEIARLPLHEQNAAMRDAIGYDPDRIREYAEERIHCFRPLTSDDVVCESDSQKKEPAGDGTDHPSPRTPVGPGLRRFRRSGVSCDNCGAEEDVACQPWCKGEQIS